MFSDTVLDKLIAMAATVVLTVLFTACTVEPVDDYEGEQISGIIIGKGKDLDPIRNEWRYWFRVDPVGDFCSTKKTYVGKAVWKMHPRGHEWIVSCE